MKLDNYKEKFKSIRGFVDFKIDLRKKISPADKAKITRYHKAVSELTSRPSYIYRPRKKQRLKTAQTAYHSVTKNLPGLKVAFINVPEKVKPKIKFDSAGDIIVETDYINKRFLEFDLQELLVDPENHIKTVLKKDRKSEAFSVKAGDHEVPNASDRDLIVDDVVNLMYQYNNDSENSFYENWLTGIFGYSYTEQQSFFDFKNKEEKERRDLSRKRRNKKERERYRKLKDKFKKK